MITRTLGSIAVLALLLSSTSCRDFSLDNTDPLNYEAEFAAPLISSRILVNDFLDRVNNAEGFEDGSLFIDSSGLIHFEYRGAELGATAEEIIADEVNAAVPPVIPIIMRRMALPFAIPNGIQLDSMVIKSGSMDYSITNNFEEEVQLDIRFPQIRKAGQMLSFSATLPAKPSMGNPPVFEADAVSLEGYAIVPLQDSVYIEYDAVRAQTQDTVDMGLFLFNIDNFAFSFAQGFLGTQTHPSGRDTIAIDFFKSWTQGDVAFVNPTVFLDFENSFGVPTEAEVTTFQVLTADGQSLDLMFSDPDLADGLDLPRATEAGVPQTTSFKFDSTNTNLRDLLNSRPSRLVYDLNGIINPSNNPADVGFVTDTSYYKAQIRVDLPLYGSASDFLIRDTFEVSLGDVQNAKEAEIKIVGDNGIPLDIGIQVEFQDEGGNVVATLLDPGELVIEGPPVDDQGNPIGEVTKTTFVPIPESEMEGLKRATVGILILSFSTSDGQAAKIEDGQEAEVRMGAILTLTN